VSEEHVMGPAMSVCLSVTLPLGVGILRDWSLLRNSDRGSEGKYDHICSSDLGSYKCSSDLRGMEYLWSVCALIGVPISYLVRALRLYACTNLGTAMDGRDLHVAMGYRMKFAGFSGVGGGGVRWVFMPPLCTVVRNVCTVTAVMHHTHVYRFKLLFYRCNKYLCKVKEH
jgi:hypothetical protein